MKRDEMNYNLYRPALLIFMFFIVMFWFVPKAYCIAFVYLDESIFLDANPIVSTETFDEFPQPTYFDPNLLTVTIDSVSYFDPGEDELPRWRIDRGNAFNPSNTLHSYRSVQNVTITFGDGRYVHAFGFRLEAWVRPNQFEIIAREIDGDIISILPESNLSGPFHFFGFSSSEGIQELTVAQRPEKADGVRTNFSFDNVSRTNIVPEPRTILLLGSGLIGLAVSMARVSGLHF